MSDKNSKFSEMFGDTVSQRIFWVSFGVVMIAASIGGAWLGAKVLVEFAKML